MADDGQVDATTGEMVETGRNTASEAIEFLSYQRSGTLLADIGEEVSKLARAVRDTGKKGTLTITFTIEPAGRSLGGQIKIEDKIVAKPPRPDVADTLMYVDSNGKLSRRDPRQPTLPLG
jgi:hypothetical protein